MRSTHSRTNQGRFRNYRTEQHVQCINGMNVTGYRSWAGYALWGEPGSFHTAPVLVLVRVSELTLNASPNARTSIPFLYHRSYFFHVAYVQQTRFSGVVEDLDVIFRSVRCRVPLPFLFLLTSLTHSNDGVSYRLCRVLPFRSGHERHLNLTRCGFD